MGKIIGFAGGIAVLCMSQPAEAASFAIIGTTPGSAQIGAMTGNVLYGTIPYSGSGVLFSMTTAGTYTALHSFDAGADGSTPDARLALTPAGELYGTTLGGGANGAGTIWEYTGGNDLKIRHSFGANGDGTVPMQGPTLGRHGTVYGATSQGAIGGSGNIFSLSKSGTYDVLYEFLSQGDGHCPFSGVALSKAGTLYGTTVGVGYGGNPNGSVWSYTAAGGLKTLYVFQDGQDGEWPNQAPVLDGAGNLYGTTYIQNGGSFAGAIWKITAAGKFSILHEMNAGTDGFAPNSPLLLNTDGKLYGTASGGGPDNDGTVFSITKSGTFAVVHSFSNTGDGAQPSGNLVRTSTGAIYGGTAYGTVFQITP